MKTVDQYIESFPPNIQERLQEMRKIVLEASIGAEEKLGYGVPSVFLNGYLVYYGAFKNHIGFYPSSEALLHFASDLSQYKSSKGAVQFPYNKPLPKSLIQEIIKYRLAKKNELKSKKK